ncbi:histidinol dehydrogenase [Parafilimonas terrae]|uniref:Histidinol dehydrogenase n=1 Tax=Parafilimonas terrae TaxID=1465490 RepID=A0A1I5SJ52_9BACT|nr:histidinol dehydrogenase [Parafilimonas terrae]SFP70732.1 histidinol dehydrogenase [Parafilimonas terrae]
MMQVIQYPKKEDWDALLKRPSQDFTTVKNIVQNILNDVKQRGDKALKDYTKQFDKIELDNFLIDDEEWQTANSIPHYLREAIQLSIKNVSAFHAAQKQPVQKIETMPGVVCWRKSVAIDKVGLYIPGGTAPLFSTLIMLGVPAKLAGCKEIILCTPPQKNGWVHPAVLYAAQQIGITEIYKIGGAQAIAAMAYGTETINKVYKIFGPGNQYITCAKMLVNAEGLAIDMPAGPSEVAVIADEFAEPEFIAADLLSQAEHGKDSQVILVADNENIIAKTIQALEEQLKALPRKDIAIEALQNSKAILVNDLHEAVKLMNEYAPEHLIINCNNAEAIAEQITNAGSVFIGNYSPESVGDYASGTNHTLPTNGFAKAYSGVSLDSFYKKITFQQLTKQGLQNIDKAVTTLAEAEGLQAHANAVNVRLKN